MTHLYPARARRVEGHAFRVLPKIILVATVLAQGVNAQAPRKSQLATVSQQIGNTSVDIIYRRPVARGRALFGALVPYGQEWTPSADSVARITFSTNVVINGASLAAGTYGIWTIPDSTKWTVIFSSAAVRHHSIYPVGKDVLRVSAVPGKGEYVESLQFAFPMADADSTQLQVRWGTTIVPLMIRAAP